MKAWNNPAIKQMYFSDEDAVMLEKIKVEKS
jgi:hypothetical protein